MSAQRLILLLTATLLVIGCDCSEETEPLRQALEEAKKQVQEREHAAQDCDDHLDTEKARNDDLDRRIRAKLPLSLQESKVVSSYVIEQLPDHLRIPIEGQINEYQLQVAREFETLKEMNRMLRDSIEKVSGQVQIESKKIRDETAIQTGTISEEISGHQQKVDTYLERTAELSEVATKLINAIQKFDQDSVNCKGCWGWTDNKKNKRQVLEFHSALVLELSAIQNQSTLAN